MASFRWHIALLYSSVIWVVINPNTQWAINRDHIDIVGRLTLVFRLRSLFTLRKALEALEALEGQPIPPSPRYQLVLADSCIFSFPFKWPDRKLQSMYNPSKAPQVSPVRYHLSGTTCLSFLSTKSSAIGGYYLLPRRFNVQIQFSPLLLLTIQTIWHSGSCPN